MIKEWIEDVLWSFKFNIVDRVLRFCGYEPIHYQPDTTGMLSYDDNNTSFITITKVIVPTEFDKDQILLGSRYLHDLRCIDTDLQAVNTLVHLYETPELVEVSSELDGVEALR